jgi:hypothetical protein
MAEGRVRTSPRLRDSMFLVAPDYERIDHVFTFRMVQGTSTPLEMRTIRYLTTQQRKFSHPKAAPCHLVGPVVQLADTLCTHHPP